MGEQSRARLKGDRYQHLYSWWLLLQLLEKDSPYEYGYVEHPTAGAADDVTLHPKEKSKVSTKYYQVKWHTDYRDQYTFDNLIEVSSGVRSLLKKLFDSWKKLKENDEPLEIWLVSNWASDKLIGEYLREESKFKEDFFICSPTSDIGVGKAKWQVSLETTEDEFHEFCRSLRLRLGFAGIEDLETMVDDRMARYGLRIGPNPRSIAKDIVSNWIEKGGVQKKITGESLIKEITNRNLWQPKADAPSVSLWIHGWQKKRFFDVIPTMELNWTNYFNRDERKIPTQEIWDKILSPALYKAKTRLAEIDESSFIDFRGKLPLTTLLAVGAKFPIVGGYKFRVEQPTQEEIFLWRSDATPSNQVFNVENIEEDENTDSVLISFAITGNSRKDSLEFFTKNKNLFKNLIYAEPNSGTGDKAIASDSDAIALANNARDIMRKYVKEHNIKNVHLLIYGPATFALFLGQRLNAVGKIFTYERTIREGYQKSIVINTD